MLFNSVLFLMVFLPAVVAAYYLAPGRPFKNLILIAASGVFYAAGGFKGFAIILLSVLVNFLTGYAIGALRERNRGAKYVLVAGVLANVALLGYFKYAGFLVESLNGIASTNFQGLDVVMPMGVSFFTFQGISYVVDVYRGRGPVQRDPLNVALYLGMFATVGSGPIVRWETFADQIDGRKERLDDVVKGIERFIIGLAKKALIAGPLGLLATSTFDAAPGTFSTAEAWIGALGYTGQIFFDFAGYTDMAIGLGMVFGFRFPENFDYPYVSQSVSEFWRRWHMSLTRWFREYIYFPLGGNRVSLAKNIRNILIVWALTGLWHGAQWSFVVWGLYFGVVMLVEKFVLGNRVERVWRPLRHLGTMLLVVLGWVIFRAETLGAGVEYLKVMFGMGGTGLATPRALHYLVQYRWELALGVLFSMPFAPALAAWWEKLRAPKLLRNAGHLLRPVAFGVVTVVSLGYILSSTFQPFLYSKF